MAKSPKLGASDLVAMYLVLVPYLIEHQEVSVADAAARFGVSEREMHEHIQRLTLIGLPGDDDFYQMPNDLFDINWDLLEEEGIIQITNHPALERPPRLTSREAAALIAGLQLVAAAPGFTETALITGLKSKLAAGGADVIAEVAIDAGVTGPKQELLIEAARLGQTVTFTYQALDAAAMTRTVTPHRVRIADGQWYMQGLCHVRQAERTFNLDRMTDVRLSEDLGVPAHATEPAAGAEVEAQVVTLRVAGGALGVLGDYTRDAEIEMLADGDALVRLHVASAQALKRLAARNAGAVRIVAPQTAVVAAQQWAVSALSAYPRP